MRNEARGLAQGFPLSPSVGRCCHVWVLLWCRVSEQCEGGLLCTTATWSDDAMALLAAERRSLKFDTCCFGFTCDAAKRCVASGPRRPEAADLAATLH